MTTRVLAVGYTARAFLPDHPVVHSFPDTVTRDDLDHLIEVVAGDPDEQTAVIAIYPAWHPEPSLQRLQTVRAAVEDTHILPYASPLPPLAGSALCALAAAVAPHIPSPGVLLGRLPLLERQLLPVARLRSVARLRYPVPSFRQHLASWWPPSSFAVSWWPEPCVRTLRKNDQSVNLPLPAMWEGPPLDKLALAVAKGDASSWMRESVADPLEVQDVLEVGPVSLVSRFWGTASVLEAVAYPTNVWAIVSEIKGWQQGDRCRWCGEQVSSTECPFCGMDRAVTLVRGAG